MAAPPEGHALSVCFAASSPRGACPLSLLRSQLPQRGSHWQAGSLSTGRLRPDKAQKGGPCYRGQRLLDNAPCQAVAGLDSGALPFPRHRALLVQTKADRHARGSPSGGAGAKRLRGQARRERTAHAAISRLFVRAMLSPRPRITVSILALSVTCGDTSPKGRGFVRTGKVCKNYKNPLQTSPRCGIIHLAASPLEIEYLPL